MCKQLCNIFWGSRSKRHNIAGNRPKRINIAGPRPQHLNNKGSRPRHLNIAAPKSKHLNIEDLDLNILILRNTMKINHVPTI